MRLSLRRDRLRKVVLTRMKILYNLALRTKDPSLRRRYGELIWKLHVRTRVEIPKYIKMHICRRCKTFLIPGVNCIVRLRQNPPHVVWRCLECGYIRRYPYVREKKKAARNKYR